MPETADAALLRKISRQLRLLNVMLVFFGLVILAGFIAAGLLFYRTYNVVQDATKQINQVSQQTKQNIDLKSQLCSNPGLPAMIDTTSICKK